MSKTSSRGEIWSATIGDPPSPHWIVVVSPDTRNHHTSISSILIVPFSSRLRESPTTIVLDPEETGLPKRSCLRAHFIQPLAKSHLRQRLAQKLSEGRMQELCLAIRRSFDPDAPY